MACHIRITGHVGLAAAKEIGRLAGDCGAKLVPSPATGIYMTSEEEDDFCDLESFCVEQRIDFTRTTYRPSQMGQEPHYVKFVVPGMTEPKIVWL